MDMYKYRFTIFTPCYNSEKFIHRVIQSVESQTYRNFEWLIIDDASTDNTFNILTEYADKSSLSIRIYKNNYNRMLYYNLNKAFDLAQGELMVFAGHDDEFDSETLEFFDFVMKYYDGPSISGIWCRCRDQFGNTIGTPFPSELLISDYHTMFAKFIYGDQERFSCTKTEILKKYKFDVENNRIGEGFLWSDIGMKYQTIYSNKVLRTYYREVENKAALTKQSRSKIAFHTYLYYKEFINIYSKFISDAIFLKIRFHFAAVLYGLICGYHIKKIILDMKPLCSKILIIVFYPIAVLLIRTNIIKI